MKHFLKTCAAAAALSVMGGHTAVVRPGSFAKWTESLAVRGVQYDVGSTFAQDVIVTAVDPHRGSGDGDFNDPTDNYWNAVWNHLYIYDGLEGARLCAAGDVGESCFKIMERGNEGKVKRESNDAKVKSKERAKTHW